jgi:hypothetical protein
MSDDSFDARQKAERPRAARRLLADKLGMVQASMALSRAFGLSRRQAYRYLELARADAPASLARADAPASPLPVENSVTVTLKMPATRAITISHIS